MFFAIVVSLRIASARVRSFQKSVWAAMDSSSATLRRLLSTSKMPPQLIELRGQAAHEVTDRVEIEVFHVFLQRVFLASNVVPRSSRGASQLSSFRVADCHRVVTSKTR